MSVQDLLALLREADSESRYHNRLSKLRSVGRNTRIIENGISDTIQVLEDGAKSFVVYGEPQSGKTEFMIALVCKLLDIGHKTIFIVMNDNTELEQQNFDRFHAAQELNPTPMRDFELASHSASELRIDHPRVIFCRKNSKNLQKLVTLCRFMKNRVLIDDEADFATPNAKINKNEVTAINKYVGELGKLAQPDGGIYIGVTATPARLDLNNTYKNNSLKWVFLDSHENYKGRDFFFPFSQAEREKSDYQLVRLPDDTDDPKLLRDAVFRFMLRVAVLNLRPGSETTAYSMLIHTAGKAHDHEVDQQALNRILGSLKDHNSTKFEQYLEELISVARYLIKLHRLDYSELELAMFVVKNIGRNEVLVINHKNDSKNVQRAGQPKSLFTFAIGGNIVSRGLTFENLLSFYFSRSVTGRLQQNTYIQRARMFGNRPYSKFFELCVPTTLFDDWANCFSDHELSLRLAKAGVYQHIQSGRTSVADKGAIDSETVTVAKSERAIGDIFELTQELERRLIDFDGFRPLTFLEQLISDGLIHPCHLPLSLIEYLRETCQDDESDLLIVRREEAGSPVLQNIERYESDGDAETITRKRGGIVHAMLNKRSDYYNYSHFILPIKNSRGRARLLYKANLGHLILQRLQPHPPVTRG